jgi:hypothetical protein
VLSLALANVYAAPVVAGLATPCVVKFVSISSRLMQTWAAADDLRTALMAWLTRQSTSVKGISMRLCKQESWQQPISGAQHIAPSVLELERLFDATAQSLTGMAVPIPAPVVRSLMELLNGLALEYAHWVRLGCSSPELLIRPPPPLTRFKKSLADKAAAGLSLTSKYVTLVLVESSGLHVVESDALTLLQIHKLVCMQS